MSHHKLPVRLRRNQNSKYLSQRRKGRKEIKLPDLAFPSASLRTCLASGGSKSRFSVSYGSPENLCKPQKLSSIVAWNRSSLTSARRASERVRPAAPSGPNLPHKVAG